ncbi:hypothetical protein GE061_013413 [Apolygus lucorum]|uniref:Uncharacterized protein n=1 Tax=Apolygus lucorum TaxID=248454 RepID=A0A8S9XNY1_APOLU|nr:hypothetical protein GE061_013413 [Apolygus lucorum]
MSDQVIPDDIARKKRVLRGDKRLDNKLRRNSGQPYVFKALTDGSTKAVCGKSGPVEATCKCVFACKSITVEARTDIFKKFWSFRNYEAQQNFLLRMIERDNIGRRRHGKYDPGHPEQSRKQHTHRFFLLLPGNSKVQVCRKTFCSTFAIGEKRARLLAEKAGTSDVVKEKRGGNRPRRDLTWKTKVIAFILQIPARESHYGREKSDKKFLSPDLNIRKLHSAFLEKHKLSQEKPPVSRQWFNLIFRKHFSLRFGPPRVDTCPKCDLYNVEIKKAKKLPDRRKFQCLLEIHHRKAEAAIQKMKNDRKLASNSVYPLVLAFDLQKQFYLPALTHTQMYYSRQLACVNFGIHKEDSGEAFFYFWSEVEGRRGCNEIGLFDYVTSNLRTEKRNAIFWSDNCGGQNKNQGILAMRTFQNEKMVKSKQKSRRFIKKSQKLAASPSVAHMAALGADGLRKIMKFKQPKIYNNEGTM